MRLNSVHLNGLRAVEAVARLGSLQKAAEELGVSPSAVSQQVGRTEAQIGQMVFDRTSSGLQATSFGRDFTARLSSGFRELEGAVAMAERAKVCVLAVSVAPAFASKWLLPRLSKHFTLYPEVFLRIDASTKLVDLDHSDIDIAIRMGDGKWPKVRAELLIAQEIFPVCSPAVAETLKTPADLAKTWEIIDESSMFSWNQWFSAAGIEPVRLQQGARFTDPMLCLDSAIAGHGVTLAWQLLAADAMADGRLVAPFGVRATSGLGYWMVTSTADREPKKVNQFKAWIRGEIEQTIGQFGPLVCAQ
ncbi:LysR substrate-binding domain-containing protein [Mesorhizobium yinganensis]|uniref:LysR substrate-binding domain-containing protein n=1 Tax=Mesorhizobium yinganensis TaxID=3157707 RepID=UPI0032B79EEE